MKEENLRVDENVLGLSRPLRRLDSYVSSAMTPSISRSYVQKLIEEGHITVNGQQKKPSYVVKPDDEISIRVPAPKLPLLEPQFIPLHIVYEDKDIIVVNKPAGLVVHPAPGNYDGTLVNALLYHCSDLEAINDTLRPGIVHRLDKDTTGLMVIAKNSASYSSLLFQMKARKIKREYLALVRGTVKPLKGYVDEPIGRNPFDRKRMAVVPAGRQAKTYFRVIERLPGYTLVKLVLGTGRTHQIRVHMSYLGYPVAGDPVYGKKGELDLNGQALHAHRLTITHPGTGEKMVFVAPLPESMKKALKRLRTVGVMLGRHE